jgi:hypothetical protein
MLFLRGSAVSMVFALLRRHAIAFVALFLLLSGAAYAVAGQVGRGARPKQFYACVAGDFHTLNLTKARRKCPGGQTKISGNAVSRRGVAGHRGQTGRTGARGADGEAGPSGTNGAVGPKGDIGATGTAGPQGSTGSQGDTGDAGPVGPAGAKGDTGATGPPVTTSYGFAMDSSTTRAPNIIRPGHPVPFAGFNGTGITVDPSGTTFTVSQSGLYQLDFLGSSRTPVFYAIEVDGVALQPQVDAKHGHVLVQQLPMLTAGDVLRVVSESGVGVMSHATFQILRVGS